MGKHSNPSDVMPCSAAPVPAAEATGPDRIRKKFEAARKAHALAEEALRALLEVARQDVRHQCKMRTDTTDDADELEQLFFLLCYKDRNYLLEEVEDWGAVLNTVVKNLAATMYRKSAARRKHEECAGRDRLRESGGSGLPPGAAPDQSGLGGPGREDLENREYRAALQVAVRSALESLPEEARIFLTLCYVKRNTLAEVGQIMFGHNLNQAEQESRAKWKKRIDRQIGQVKTLQKRSRRLFKQVPGLRLLRELDKQGPLPDHLVEELGQMKWAPPPPAQYNKEAGGKGQ